MDKSTALSSVFVGDDNPNNNNTLTTTPLMVTPLLPPVITTPDDDVDNTELAPRVMVRPRQAPTRVTTFAELMKVTKKQTYNNNNNNNVSSLASSLMVTSAHKIGDVISLEDLMRLTDSPPPPYLMVTPAEPVAPVIASEDGVMVTEETRNTEPFAPLVVTPAEPVAPVIASEDGVMVTEEPRNTEPLAPLVVTPAEPVAPVIASEDGVMVTEETRNTEPFAPLMVTPAEPVAPVIASEDGVMVTEETRNTEPFAPLVVTPAEPVAPVIASEDGVMVTEEPRNTEPLAPLVVTPAEPVAPVIASEDGVMVTEETRNTEPFAPLMVTPAEPVAPVIASEDGVMVTEETRNTEPFAPLVVTPAEPVAPVIASEDGVMVTEEPRNTEPLAPLVVTPAEPVAPVIASEDGVMVTEETRNTEPFAPLMVTPAEPVAPVIASEDGVMVTEETRNTEPFAPLVVTPAEPVALVFTESEDDVMMINEETHNLESLPFALVTPLAKATLVTGSDDDVMMITEETDHNTEPLAPAMVTVPDKPLAAVTAPDDDDDVMIIESLPAPTVTPPPAAATDTTLHNVMITMVDRFSFESHSDSLMVTPLRTAPPPPPQVMVTSLAMVPYGYDFNNDNAAAEAGPSTGPIKRGRGRPIGSKNKISKTATKKRKTPDTDGEIAKPSPKLGRPKGAKNKKPKAATKEEKTPDPERRLIRSCPSHFDSGITQEELRDGFQEVVDSVLMKADAVRRRLYQVNSKWAINAVITNCINLGVKTNQTRRIGPVPGVHVGDIFYACGEMSLVGLHLAQMAGIDKFKAEDNSSEGLVATSVVSNSRYNDDMSDLNALIYTGHGGKGKDGKPCDQILRSGNKAMAESKTKGNDVRVIIGEEVGKKETIYVYDGLYTVIDHWEDLVLKNIGTESKEFKEFKFKLVRKPNQLPGYSTWKAIEQWRKEGSESSREGFVLGDLSGGEEALPVTVVNDLDVTDKQPPIDFEYTRSLIYTSTASATTPPIDPETALTATGCAESCRGRTCFTENADCVCVRKNGNELPYYNQFLVCRKPTVFECGDSCHCVSNCKNRVVQMGVKLRLEVFKTESRGWGLRSWDPIRAGTFICEFAGKNKTEQEIQEDDDDDDDEYLFDSSRVFESFQWNYEPELTMESGSERVCEEFELKSRILISGKSHGNVGRFMNHSCWANVMWQPVECEQNGEFYYRVGLFAKKHIPPLKELTYDYGVSGVKGKKVCLCGSYNCRGFFG